MSDIKTKYGTVELTIHPQVQTYKQTRTRKVIGQGPMLRAFKAAERRFYVATTPKWKRVPLRVRHIPITGVGYRSFELQYTLWRSDSSRYANPYSSMHVKGLAVDISQGQDDQDEAEKALRSVGFKDGASFGDPPHWSFPVSG